MKNTGKREDRCFVCKDGGSLFACDYEQCLKAYHARCVDKDEQFFDSGNRLHCNWHSCLICHQNSKFHCFCCPNAVCNRCIIKAEFACVREEKGFCNHCLKLAPFSEENVDVDSGGEKVDFRDGETYEGLFMEYWDIIKKQEGLTLKNLRSANAQLEKIKKIKSGSYVVKSEEGKDDVMEHIPVKKNKKSKGKQLEKKRKVSKKREFIGWGSKSLIDFLASIGKDTSKELSQLQVSNIFTEYINENRLFNPEKKRLILCDEKLKSVLGRKTVNRNLIYDILGPHFVDNLETSEDDDDFKSSEDDDENLLVACKKQKKLSTCRKMKEKEEVLNAPRSCFASITAENIKLVYLRRSLVQELLKRPGTFEGRVLGSFVKVKSEFIDFTQRCSHQLLPVTGMKKVTVGENKTEFLFQVSNMSIDICINMLSDDNFSEEECEDLRQKVKGGLLRRLTIVELEHKAKSLHEDITNHWINRELALLQNRIDHANEKGWRRELFEYMERKKLLQTPEEKLRLLETVPRVIADVAEVEPISNNAIEESKQEDGRSKKSILMGSSETPGDNGGSSGFSSGTLGAGGDRAVTNRNYDFGNCGFSSANYGNGNAQATQQNDIGRSIQGIIPMLKWTAFWLRLKVEKMKGWKAPKTWLVEKKDSNVQVDMTPYRSSLGGIMNLIKELKLTECHKVVLKRTPFWKLFDAVIKGKVNTTQCRKSGKLIVRIIQAYDPRERKFRLGAEFVELTSGDIRHIFGISGGNEDVSLKYGVRDDVKMVERQSLQQLRLTAPDIRHLLNVYVDGDAQEDIKDVARLLCLYLCHTLLFPTRTTVKWVYLERDEDLEKLNGYNWCAAIVNELLASIHKHHHQPKKVLGCVMVLLYWLCEHTNLVESQFPNATPAFVKWSIPSLTRKFNTASFKNLNRTQVVTGLPNVMVPSSLEILINVVCAEENQTVSNAALQCNKSILPSSSSHENESHETTGVDNCAHIDQHKGENESHTTPMDNYLDSYFSVDITSADCAHIAKEPKDNEDHNVPGDVEEKTREIHELHIQLSKMNKQMEEFNQKAKQRETEHARDIDLRDAEIVRLNETVLYLLNEKSQLADELDESVVHAITRQAQGGIDEGTNVKEANATGQLQQSMYLQIKAKPRKGTEQPESVYQLRKQKIDVTQRSMPWDTKTGQW